MDLEIELNTYSTENFGWCSYHSTPTYPCSVGELCYDFSSGST